MRSTTLPYLKCPVCSGRLVLSSKQDSIEIHSGRLLCQKCSSYCLILAGVAILVKDTYDYLLTHVKGVSKVVRDEEIPAEFREDFLKAKAEILTEHIEEDLEAERVNALYLTNHYLRADTQTKWWQRLSCSDSLGAGSPLIEKLILEYWDQGPFEKIKEWIAAFEKPTRFKSVLELGCGVGGLHFVLRPYCDFYLGADCSFASIALARHLALGIPYPGDLRIPNDLLQGAVAREIKVPLPIAVEGRADFVVTDIQNPAIAGGWDLTLSLNMIDMLENPENLPKLQYGLLEPRGIVIQSCPYIWHEAVAQHLRQILPSECHGDSARAVEWLYRENGFELEKSVDHLPWLFFKHVRQLEIYSVHLFLARKKSEGNE